LAILAANPESTSTTDPANVWTGRLEFADGFLILLAKAVRQLHAYPLTSQVCVDAVEACRHHLGSVEGTDELALHVSPDALLLHERPVGETALVRQELLRRLRRARVTEFAIHRESTARDLTRFIANLIRASEAADRALSLTELMLEDGVESVTVEVTARREVLPLSAPAPAQRDLVAHERRRREEAEANGTRRVHLFPPHRGWIRLDPAESYAMISLADLAILVDDPHRLAGMLHRLVDEAPDEGNDTFRRRFSDISRLFSGLEPRLSRVMFGKLAQAVLALDPEPRNALLSSTILPAIFDGRPDATVLHAFPDADLAEALCLLINDESGAPAVLVSALDQLQLEPERRTAVATLVEELTRARSAGDGLDDATAMMLDQHARRLTKIDPAERRSFVELAGFDFRLDAREHEAIDAVRTGIHTADGMAVELACLANIVGIQSNPEKAEPFMQAAMTRAATLVTENRWDDLATALQRFAAIAASMKERRPEIAATIENSLVAFATPELAAALMAQHRTGPSGERAAVGVIDGLGAAIAPSLLELLTTDGANSSAAVALMCERATLFAPMLVENLATSPPATRPHVARVLGHAGSGYEEFAGSLLDKGDERTAREALRALSRIGTERAAELVARAARDSRGWMTTATVETLLRFPVELAAVAIRNLLAHRQFVMSHPEAASRLIGRVSPSRDPGLAPVLQQLRSLRFRFWNRALVRVAADAAALLDR
jgi:hypothetical protein